MLSRSIYQLLTLLAVRGAVLSSGPGNQGHWENLPSIPAGPRQEHCAHSIGDTLYIIGGISNPLPNVTTVATVEAYNTKENTWKRLADLPVAMHHCNLAFVRGELYLLGGLNDKGDLGGPSFKYSPREDVWTGLPDLPKGSERGASAVGVWKDKIFLAGGVRVFDPTNGERGTIASGLVYDTRSTAWAALPDLPEGRDHAGSAVIDGTFYVVGGRMGGDNTVRGTVFAMDLKAEKRAWVEKKGMPTPRGGLIVAGIDGKIYTFGGAENPSERRPSGVFDNTEVYDTKTDSWEVLPPMNVPRHGAVAMAVEGKIYIPGGGIRDSGYEPVDVFDVFNPM